jgi:hypothetical protein
MARPISQSIVEEDAKYIARMPQFGVTVYVPTDKERALFAMAAQSIIKEYAARGPKEAKIIDIALKTQGGW